ncbi:MAG: toxin HigB-2 [Zetaproteobacteria bacterium CG06_land_8_20_14_3_00_59_53]|nr:MAG: toxin HigB-2 [Zetaproteobacteria bacterium CG2_30_59_37]PIO90670.1 MAG: toxin HigB-2 [Zetaproteobacteria bacterium CG23_combo_of_CG06-09_8_20_14_all_59_86]PIQ66067.1 MAG: toxin HigB-2 [Zetaproteobacteria bacterium CG11_big_fil_rev_8_21_14_0_20_59_439]PIU70007.1 MAG: toxin HigB-2 [Zetaproteobacteria bacterium CG06_land_8_20_14_3_00_59_53]PIU97877.1 MAG: toxin HigB-2 [Zetaproteobacteria bacterium CG03_land_8_20_14_0_80_59_51]PIY45850.1 MAG: toxin HigB-2 [Zetaproteobacteria bacterium CG_4
MIIFETSIFTRQITTLMDDDEYAEFQGELAERPDMGVRIPGSGGLRKVRVTAKGHGKRGGARVIYYWAMSDSRIFMLLAYAKNEQEDLTKDQLKVLKALVEEEFGDG